jgi:hypothetical protein
MQIELEQWIGLSPLMLLYAFFAIGVAAYIRGYSGFGFSALTVTSLALILAPSEVVPTAYMLEVAASIHMLPLVWRSIDWKILRWLVFGAVMGTPFGIIFLEEVPQEMMRLVISAIVLIASLLLWKNIRMRSSANWYSILAVGFFSGVINGAAAIGGLPVVLFFLSISLGSALSRASMVAYLFIIDLYAVFLPGSQQLISTELLGRTILFLIPLLVGIFIGHRSFVKTTPESFRKFALSLLIFLSAAVIFRSVLI